MQYFYEKSNIFIHASNMDPYLMNKIIILRTSVF
jgi:hypothetical protein